MQSFLNCCGKKDSDMKKDNRRQPQVSSGFTYEEEDSIIDTSQIQIALGDGVAGTSQIQYNHNTTTPRFPQGYTGYDPIQQARRQNFNIGNIDSPRVDTMSPEKQRELEATRARLFGR